MAATLHSAIISVGGEISVGHIHFLLKVEIMWVQDPRIVNPL